MLIAIAKFIGQDGSMGLTHEYSYIIIIQKNMVYIEGLKKGSLWSCPYGSGEALLKNWNVREIIRDVKSVSDLRLAFTEEIIKKNKTFRFLRRECFNV